MTQTGLMAIKGALLGGEGLVLHFRRDAVDAFHSRSPSGLAKKRKEIELKAMLRTSLSFYFQCKLVIISFSGCCIGGVFTVNSDKVGVTVPEKTFPKIVSTTSSITVILRKKTKEKSQEKKMVSPEDTMLCGLVLFRQTFFSYISMTYCSLIMYTKSS